MNTVPDATAVRIDRSRIARAATGALVAVVATSATAAIARAAGVSLEVDNTQIPLAAFAFWTVVSAAIGLGLTASVRDRTRLIRVTGVGTVLSLIPAIAAPDDHATRVVLVLAHLIAAAIIVPALAGNARFRKSR